MALGVAFRKVKLQPDILISINKLKSYGDNMHFYSYNDLSTNEIENYADHTEPYFLLAGYTNYTPDFEKYYAPTKSLMKGLKIGYKR